jgi:hypothetical protein
MVPHSSCAGNEQTPHNVAAPDHGKHTTSHAMDDDASLMAALALSRVTPSLFKPDVRATSSKDAHGSSGVFGQGLHLGVSSRASRTSPPAKLANPSCSGVLSPPPSDVCSEAGKYGQPYCG